MAETASRTSFRVRSLTREQYAFGSLVGSVMSQRLDPWRPPSAPKAFVSIVGGPMPDTYAVHFSSLAEEKLFDRVVGATALELRRVRRRTKTAAEIRLATTAVLTRIMQD